MKVGANWPYDPPGRNAPDITWDTFAALNPTQVLVPSHVSEHDVRRLAQSYPGLLWHIRVKGNKWWLPADLNAREWANEFNPIELARLLISFGIKPTIVILNEVDVELTPDWKADDKEHKENAINWYVMFASVCLDQLTSSFGAAGGLYDVSLSPLSQGGPPERFESWWSAFVSSGLLARTTRVAEHCYFGNKSFDDLQWGSRWRTIREATLLPIDILETNDNGEVDTADRPRLFNDYVEYLWSSGEVAAVSLFTLPGGAQDQQAWWRIGIDTARAVGELHDIVDDAPPVADVPTIPPAPAPELNAWEYWSANDIASVAVVNVGNVRKYWPTIHEALHAHGIGDKRVQAAIIGTIAVETASLFAPIDEFYSDRWNGYSGGPTYHGRGFIQLTHDYNYKRVGDAIGFDLLNNPHLANDPFVAAMALANYCASPRNKDGRSVADCARELDWEWVRRKVLGGTAKMEVVQRIGMALLAMSDGTTVPTSITYVFPINNYEGQVNLHWGSFIGGADLFAPRGQSVVTMVRGTVVDVGYSNIGGYYLLYKGVDGLDYYYAHGDRASTMRKGQNVQPGQFVFGVGDTGNAVGTGAHLHIGIGYGIINGSGPTGGAGANFDAVSLLRNILSGNVNPPVDEGEDMAKVAELEGVIAELQRQIAGKDAYAHGVVEGFAHTADVLVPSMVTMDRKKDRKRVADEVASLRTARIGPKP